MFETVRNGKGIFSTGNIKPLRITVGRNMPTSEINMAVCCDSALDEISNLDTADYDIHFEKAANDFMEESDEKERIDFLKFAMKLVNADEKIAREESALISRLFTWWGI